MKKTNKYNNKHTPQIETFLFCPTIEQAKKIADPAHFFLNLDEVADNLSECVVFFNLSSALQYSRFMNHGHAVLRAFVDHTAVEGFPHKLGIKKGSVTKHDIHGGFPGWGKGALYLENPDFNAAKLPTAVLQSD